MAWVFRLPNYLDGELNFSRSSGCPRQQTCHTGGRPGGIENIGIIRSHRRAQISVVENIEYLRAELHVEVLRDPANVIVLEDGEVHVHQSRTNQDVAAGITTQVETGIRGQPWSSVKGWILRVPDNNLVAVRVDQAVWHGVAVLVPKRRSRRCGNGETLGFNVVGRISRISQGLASGTTKPVGKSPIVAAVGVGRITTRTPGRGRRDA